MRSWFESLTPPDNVGASEYRAIYEVLHDALDSDQYSAAFPRDETEADRLDLAAGILSEFITHAQSMQNSLVQYLRDRMA